MEGGLRVGGRGLTPGNRRRAPHPYGTLHHPTRSPYGRLTCSDMKVPTVLAASSFWYTKASHATNAK